MDCETVVTELPAGGQVSATTFINGMTKWDWRPHPNLIWRPIDHATYLAALDGEPIARDLLGPVA